MLHEQGVAGLHHHGRAAHVDIVVREVLVGAHHGVADKAGLAVPVIAGLRFGQHRRVAEVGMFAGKLLRQRIEVQVASGAHAPEQVYGALDADLEGMLEDALQRCEAGAAADENNRPVGVLAQEKGPQRPLDAQQGLFLHVVEDLVGKQPAFHVADVQLDELVVVRRVGNGERAGVVAPDQHIDVLPGEKLQAFRGGHLQVDANDVVGEVLEFLDAGGQRLDLDVAGRVDLAHLDGQVAVRACLAEQRLAGGGIVIAEGRRIAVFVADAAVDDTAHAGAAGPVAAAVGQYNPLAQRGIEDGFTGIHREGVAAGLYCDLIRHSIT